MKGSVIFLLITIVIGITGVGILTNDVFLIVQKISTFAGIPTFNTFMCLCEQPEVLFAPGQTEPEFGMEFCDFEEFLASPPNPPNTPNPGYIGAVGDATCNIETLNGLNLAAVQFEEFLLLASASLDTSGNINSKYGSALIGYEYLGEGCSAEFWDANRYNPIDYVWPDGTDPEDTYNTLFGTDLTIHRVVVTTEQEPTDETLVPLRGRVSSDGVSIGTATLRDGSSSEDTQSTDSSEDRQTIEISAELVVPRSASNSVEAVGWTTLNSIEDSGGSIQGTGIIQSPSLSNMLTIPDIEHRIGSLNALATESVTALLNARHPGIHYFYTEQQVIDLTQRYIDEQNYGPLTEELQVYNGRGEINFCPNP